MKLRLWQTGSSVVWSGPDQVDQDGPRWTKLEKFLILCNMRQTPQNNISIPAKMCKYFPMRKMGAAKGRGKFVTREISRIAGQSVVFLLLISILLVDVSAQIPQNSWKSIFPLKSNRIDVERVLGKPTDPKLDLYETNDEVVTIWYSQKKCGNSLNGPWNVPKGTVLQILVSPKGMVNAEIFKASLMATLNKEKDPFTQNTFLYYVADKSIMFQTRLLQNGEEDILFVAYAPTMGDYVSLRCIKQLGAK